MAIDLDPKCPDAGELFLNGRSARLAEFFSHAAVDHGSARLHWTTNTVSSGPRVRPFGATRFRLPVDDGNAGGNINPPFPREAAEPRIDNRHRGIIH